MGPAGDHLSVVDTRCRVNGVERLRVVDASCMPTITSGNTNAPTLMLAQVARDLATEIFAAHAAAADAAAADADAAAGCDR
jgi:choline dehydrogenase